MKRRPFFPVVAKGRPHVHYTLTATNINILNNAIDMAIASSKRAKNTSKRPEFNVIYDKEIAELHAIKASITPVPEQTTRQQK